MNSNISSLITDFAKNNRIGKQRVEEFVSKIVENCSSKQNSKSNSKRDNQFLFVKNAIIARAKNFEVFSYKQISQDLGVSMYLVHKAVKECKKENIVKQAEYERVPGARGKQTPLWMLA